MSQSRSKKPRVVEYLFEKLSAEDRTVVTLEDVRAAIIYCNEQYGLDLSPRNPANFMKDMVRGRSASSNWPESLKLKRIGGKQRVGDGRVLEFVPYAEGQTDPFENSFTPSTNLSPVALQSINLPLTAKSLGRKDETWLIQVAVALRVIEQHLATRSRDSRLEILEVTHLQIGVKLATSEVDALFLAVGEREARRFNILVTCEAKQENERILEDQIVGQVIAANRSVKSLDLEIGLILPVAIKAMIQPVGSIYVAEFEEWTPEQAEAETAAQSGLRLVAESLFQLQPPVAGIGYRPRRVIKGRG